MEKEHLKLSHRLYNSVQDIWPSYLEHPFVLEMAKGTLPPEKFRYYMLQDYVYLRDYVKIFAACISKADDFGLIRFFGENIMAVLDETERVHIPYMKRLGITDEEIESVTPHISNSSYSSYMICQAQSGTVLSGLVALLNCSWAYAYIGENMVKRFPDAVHHPYYGQWFSGYVCDDYLRTNQQLIDMVDSLSGGITPQEISRLCRIFRTCSLHELQFWDMAYAAGK